MSVLWLLSCFASTSPALCLRAVPCWDCGVFFKHEHSSAGGLDQLCINPQVVCTVLPAMSSAEWIIRAERNCVTICCNNWFIGGTVKLFLSTTAGRMKSSFSIHFLTTLELSHGPLSHGNIWGRFTQALLSAKRSTFLPSTLFFLFLYVFMTFSQTQTHRHFSHFK